MEYLYNADGASRACRIYGTLTRARQFVHNRSMTTPGGGEGVQPRYVGTIPTV